MPWRSRPWAVSAGSVARPQRHTQSLRARLRGVPQWSSGIVRSQPSSASLTWSARVQRRWNSCSSFHNTSKKAQLQHALAHRHVFVHRFMIQVLRHAKEKFASPPACKEIVLQQLFDPSGSKGVHIDVFGGMHCAHTLALQVKEVAAHFETRLVEVWRKQKHVRSMRECGTVVSSSVAETRCRLDDGQRANRKEGAAGKPALQKARLRGGAHLGDADCLGGP